MRSLVSSIYEKSTVVVVWSKIRTLGNISRGYDSVFQERLPHSCYVFNRVALVVQLVWTPQNFFHVDEGCV